MDIITKERFDIIVKHARSLCPNIRKPKYTHQYYLTNIIDVLSDFVKWASLRKSINITGKKPYHYKTIADIHKLWSDEGVYASAFAEISKINDTNLDKNDFIELLIDSTLIINKSGIECIGFGSESKKKKFTKISALSDHNANCKAIMAHSTYDKEISFGKNKPRNKPITMNDSDIFPIHKLTTSLFKKYDLKQSNKDAAIDIIVPKINKSLFKKHDLKQSNTNTIDIIVPKINKSLFKKHDITQSNKDTIDIIVPKINKSLFKKSNKSVDNDETTTAKKNIIDDPINKQVNKSSTAKYINISTNINISDIIGNLFDKPINKLDDKPVDDVKKIKIKTLEHDIKAIVKLGQQIENKGKKMTITGDKGYILNQNDKNEILEKYKIDLIHPYKSNQKKQNTSYEKDKLKKRYKVENLFSRIKCFNRVHVRRDKTINAFMGFVFLACIIKTL